MKKTVSRQRGKRSIEQEKKELHGMFSDKRIAVVCGGSSSERDISLKSGAAVYGALINMGIDTRLIDADKDALIKMMSGGDRPDLVFIALHGRGGEDGSLQGLLDIIGIPYTGSGTLSSALAMNKVLSKQIFAYNNIPVPGWISLKSDYPSDMRIKRFPAVIKPVDQGSTIGVSIVKKQAEVNRAVKNAFRYSETILIEEFIDGQELTVGILGQEPLDVMEIKPLGPFYDYKSKYLPGGSEHIIPAHISRLLYSRVQAMALKAHRSLLCKGMSRVDILLDSDQKPYILEVNTIPGMTETSLLPEAARFRGIDFEHLVLSIMHYSLNIKEMK